jgi:FHS family L-fucose permease-like MFS transporter
MFLCKPRRVLTIARTYPLCVNFVPAYREVADSFSTTEIGIRNSHANDAENATELPKNESPAHTEAVDGDGKA